jgi:hypothetical protein
LECPNNEKGRNGKRKRDGSGRGESWGPTRGKSGKLTKEAKEVRVE